MALFRILVALVVLSDLLLRLRHSPVLYSDEGVLPRSLAIEANHPDRWSLLFAYGSPEFTNIFLLIGIAAASLMLAGWRTRAATIVLWIVIVSIQARNNHVAYGGDTLIRLSLFWAMFLPLGSVWSLDSQREPRRTIPLVSNLATFGLLVLNASVYLFTAILKSGERWRSDFDAVYYAVGMRDLSTPLGEWLFQHASAQFFTMFTAGTLWMEFAVPIMLLLPVRTGLLRMVAVALVISLHLGIGATMYVGLFPAISVACIAVVLPSGFWAFLVRTRIAHLTQMSGRDKQQVNPVPQPAMGVTSPASSSHQGAVLRFVPDRVPDASGLSRSLINLVCLAAIVLGLMWNVSAVSSYEPPEPMRRTAVVTGLYQDWAMFAPNPRAATVWFLIEGELADGDKVDLLVTIMDGDFSEQHPLILDQSNDVLLNHEHWRKYLNAIRNRGEEGLNLAGYACRNWNAENTGEDRLETVTFTVASAQTLPNSERAEPAYQQVGFWTCN